MGNTSSFPEAHIRIYKNLLAIQNLKTRAEMIQALLQGPEYVRTFRQAGIYPQMLTYVSKIQQGQNPGLLPGEQAVQQPQQRQTTATTLATRVETTTLTAHQRLTKHNSNEKALTYFQMCLQVLNLEEEVALTDDELKKAYKKAAFKAHPDKGGSEQHFEAVTRAYAYLTEILKRIQGGRSTLKKVDAPTLLKTERVTEAEAWKQADPVRLNPDKLDLNAFNKMFEQTRVPEPDGDGYGDWLKGEGDGKTSDAPNFSGKFNRDVFNTMFEQESSKNRDVRQTNAMTIAAPQSLLFNPSYGVELGRGRPDSFTTAANDDGALQYTDLKAAYTTESTFSGQVADVRVDPRSFEQYQQSRKTAPTPLRDEEMTAIQQMEREAEERERRRKIRAADEMVQADDYHQRMKRLVITDGVPLDRQKRR